MTDTGNASGEKDPVRDIAKLLEETPLLTMSPFGRVRVRFLVGDSNRISIAGR
jgi:hypothetical protein